VADPQALLRTRSYVGLLVMAAVIGVPVSAAAYGFLALVDYLQKEIFTHLPHGLGFQAEPVWWPLPVLAIGGLLIALAIRYLPGRGGPSPAGGFKMHGAPAIAELPGVVLAALATLVFGTVLGPEMPLILLGGGLALLFLRLARRDVPERARSVVASAGSFAAISTLMGSPILGAFLLMEASGLGGPMLEVVLLPGLLAAGAAAHKQQPGPALAGRAGHCRRQAAGAGLDRFYVGAAAVGAQPVQRHYVRRDDHQGPERVGGEEEHLVYGVEPDHDDGKPAGHLVAYHYPDSGEELQDGKDEGNPAPGPQVAEHVVRVGHEHVRVRDGGDAVDHVPEADHQQQHPGEKDQAVPAPLLAVNLAPAAGWPHCCRRHFCLPCRVAGLSG
jgi:hypothetical protein